MHKLLFISIVSVFSVNLIFSQAKIDRKKVASHLQDISVTIKSEGKYNKSEGSGVLITRKIGSEQVTFVWTCAHVVDNLRNVRSIVDESGSSKKIIEFDDVQIVKELVESGRRVGEIKMDAQVIKYSDYNHGHDLALLMVRAKDYGKSSASFYLDKEDTIVPIGTRLYHVGSLLGQMGANSMTTGIISQVGRVEAKVEFDQTTVTAFPGSSGGGVYLENGKYVGMIARGAGEGFNLMIPIRRMTEWAKENKVLWALDPSEKTPTLKEIKELPIESSSKSSGPIKTKKKEYKFLIRVEDINNQTSSSKE